MLTACLAFLAGTGCDGLLDVSNPGSIRGVDLNDPALAGLLIRSVESDFDCFFSNYIEVSALWVGEIDGTTAARIPDQVGLRDPAAFTDGATGGADCRDGVGAGIGGLPLHVARTQAAHAIGMFEQFTDAVVPNKNFLIAKATVYEAFTYQIAGETFCEPTFDLGPVLPRPDVWRIAEQRFTKAIEIASQITTGANAAEAGQLVQAALVGRARARLNLGDMAGVVSDASLVQEGFVFQTWHSSSDNRLRNQVYERVGFGRGRSVSDVSRARSVLDGVPDPRVRWEERGLADRSAQIFYPQLKYTSFADPIPIASWREAQLMIAEASGGQVAVDVINRLRATYSLPQFSSTNEAEIREQVREERRRELWLQTGSRIGDLLRWNEPWRTGFDAFGRPYSSLTCVPNHMREIIANPNLRS